MNTCSRDIKNVTLELGGKSAAIVFDDCDIDKTIEWVMFVCFWFVTLFSILSQSYFISYMLFYICVLKVAAWSTLVNIC